MFDFSLDYALAMEGDLVPDRALAAELIEGIADHGVSADHASFNFNEMLKDEEQQTRTFLSPSKKKK